MTAIKFPSVNAYFTRPGCAPLPGETKDGIIRTQWELSNEERAIIAAGGHFVVEFQAATVPPMRLAAQHACTHCNACFKEGDQFAIVDGRTWHPHCYDIAQAGA